MKNRLPAADRPAKRPKPPKGRWARVWLSPEFVAWCERSSVVPKEIAPCVLHSWGLKHPGCMSLTIVSKDPEAAERIFRPRKEPR